MVINIALYNTFKIHDMVNKLFIAKEEHQYFQRFNIPKSVCG